MEHWSRRGDHASGDAGLHLRAVVARSALPALVAAVASLAVVLVLMGYLLLSLEPRLSELRTAQQDARDGNAAMLDQETGVRGYLAAGETQFLEPYRTGQETSERVESDLVNSLRGDADLVAAASLTLAAQHRWQTQWAIPAVTVGEDVADTNRDGTTTAAEFAAYMDIGKVLFDDYREQDEALRAALRAEIDDTEGALASGLTASGAALLAIAAGAVLWQLRARRRLQHDVVEPVLALTDTVDRVRTGDLELPEPRTHRVSELAELATGVAEMTGALAERERAAQQREVDLRRRSERLERMLELSRGLTESLSLRYTTVRLVEAVRELAGAGCAELWLQGDGAGELVLFESCTVDPDNPRPGREPTGTVVRVGAGPIGRAARYGRALPLDESQRGVDDDSSGVAIPMQVGAQVVAVVAIRGMPGTALDLSFLDGLLLQGASAIQAAQLHAEVEEMSRRDALTGLANRRQFDIDLAAEVERAQRYERPLCLVMIDLDHFKRINDVYGHRRGDEVLQDVAGLINADLRENDICYRYGGEELCVILPECGAEEAAAVADRIRGHVAESFPWAVRPPVTLSAGVAQLTRTLDPSGLVGAADQALYAAKHAGRNLVRIAGVTVDPKLVTLVDELDSSSDPARSTRDQQ